MTLPCTAVGALRSRARQRVAGSLRSVTYRPRGHTPALVGRLSDGTGTVDLLWLGRRTVPGVEPGRRLVAEGMVTLGDSGPMMYNPDYRLEAREGPA